MERTTTGSDSDSAQQVLILDNGAGKIKAGLFPIPSSLTDHDHDTPTYSQPMLIVPNCKAQVKGGHVVQDFVADQVENLLLSSTVDASQVFSIA